LVLDTSRLISPSLFPKLRKKLLSSCHEDFLQTCSRQTACILELGSLPEAYDNLKFEETKGSHCTPDNIALVTKFRATISSNVAGFYANFAGNNSISSEFTHTKLHHAIRVA
jgi:hypothetical protein